MPTGSSMRDKIAASSFSGLFTRVEIGHIVMGAPCPGARGRDPSLRVWKAAAHFHRLRRSMMFLLLARGKEAV